VCKPHYSLRLFSMSAFGCTFSSNCKWTHLAFALDLFWLYPPPPADFATPYYPPSHFRLNVLWAAANFDAAVRIRMSRRKTECGGYALTANCISYGALAIYIRPHGLFACLFSFMSYLRRPRWHTQSEAQKKNLARTRIIVAGILTGVTCMIWR